MNIFQASRLNDLAALGEQLTSRPDRVHEREADSDWTPLHHATAGGNLKAARLLLDAEADPNARGQAGETPLHLVLQRDIAELLIAHGADPLQEDNEGATPLGLALEDRNEELFLVLAAGAPDLGSPNFQFLKAARQLDLTVKARYHDQFHRYRIHELGWNDEMERCQAFQLSGTPGWQILSVDELSDFYFDEPVSPEGLETAPELPKLDRLLS